MFQLEDTYFSLASTQKRNCLVICDRGAMDASAYLPREDWEEILDKNSLNEVDIRDNRFTSGLCSLHQRTLNYALITGMTKWFIWFQLPLELKNITHGNSQDLLTLFLTHVIVQKQQQDPHRGHRAGSDKR